MIVDWGADWLNGEKIMFEHWVKNDLLVSKKWMKRREESDWKLSKIMIRQWVRSWLSSE